MMPPTTRDQQQSTPADERHQFGQTVVELLLVKQAISSSMAVQPPGGLTDLHHLDGRGRHGRVSSNAMGQTVAFDHARRASSMARGLKSGGKRGCRSAWIQPAAYRWRAPVASARAPARPASMTNTGPSSGAVSRQRCTRASRTGCCSNQRRGEPAGGHQTREQQPITTGRWSTTPISRRVAHGSIGIDRDEARHTRTEQRRQNESRASPAGTADRPWPGTKRSQGDAALEVVVNNGSTPHKVAGASRCAPTR